MKEQTYSLYKKTMPEIKQFIKDIERYEYNEKCLKVATHTYEVKHKDMVDVVFTNKMESYRKEIIDYLTKQEHERKEYSVLLALIHENIDLNKQIKKLKKL